MNQSKAVTRTALSNSLVNRCRSAVVNHLDHLQFGQLEIHESGSRWVCGDIGELHAEISIHNPNAWVAIALGGSIGAAESYMRGEWDSRDVTTLVRLLARNMDTLDKLESKQRWFTQLARKLSHIWQSNSLKGSRRNISKHYDLGNDMFRLWLDPLMMYSSAIYPDATATLDVAAEYKLKRVAEKLHIKPEDHVLEIGTGWGGLSIYLAQHYGCRVTTTTISKQQHDEAKKRVEALGLEDKIELLLVDYRELTGQYDKIVSIEMIEAVGLAYLPTYFEQCSHLLKDNGAFLLQSITIADQRYDYAARHVDFIQTYIFPGGALPSNTRIAECVRDHTDMLMVQLEDIGFHYAQTLADWRRRFHAHKQEILAQGYDETFLRLWHYYLSYCEGAFMERATSCAQILLHKKQCSNPVS